MQNAMHSYHHDICYAVQGYEEDGEIVWRRFHRFFLSFGWNWDIMACLFSLLGIE